MWCEKHACLSGNIAVRNVITETKRVHVANDCSVRNLGMIY